MSKNEEYYQTEYYECVKVMNSMKLSILHNPQERSLKKALEYYEKFAFIMFTNLTSRKICNT